MGRFFLLLLTTICTSGILLAQETPEGSSSPASATSTSDATPEASPSTPPVPASQSPDGTEPPPPPPPHEAHAPGKKGPGRSHSRSHKKGVPFPTSDDHLESLLQKYPEEKHQDIKENYERWKKLSPERQEALRAEYKRRHDRMQQDAQRALEQADLPHLTPEQKEEFYKTYTSGRRKIEIQLRRDLEEKRKLQLDALINDLKTRFGE